MILVDSSVWIDHFRRPIDHLDKLLDLREALTHPLVVGELAMGGLPERRATLRALSKLPALPQASHAEVMAFIEWQGLSGTRVGFIDAHLLASARFTDGCRLWSIDKPLRAQAERLGIAYRP